MGYPERSNSNTEDLSGVLLSCGILQQLRVHVFPRYLDESNYRSSNKTAFDWYLLQHKQGIRIVVEIGKASMAYEY